MRESNILFLKKLQNSNRRFSNFLKLSITFVLIMLNVILPMQVSANTNFGSNKVYIDKDAAVDVPNNIPAFAPVIIGDSLLVSWRNI
ncbi:MAG: hypothetical protein RR642_10470, partial [Solibacillus sp.]